MRWQRPTGLGAVLHIAAMAAGAASAAGEHAACGSVSVAGWDCCLLRACPASLACGLAAGSLCAHAAAPAPAARLTFGHALHPQPGARVCVGGEVAVLALGDGVLCALAPQTGHPDGQALKGRPRGVVSHGPVDSKALTAAHHLRRGQERSGQPGPQDGREQQRWAALGSRQGAPAPSPGRTCAAARASVSVCVALPVSARHTAPQMPAMAASTSPRVQVSVSRT